MPLYWRITSRFREFLRVTFGDEHYDENLRFIETALGKKGNEQQNEQLQKVTDACAGAGIRFTWEFDQSGSIHAHHIVTNHGWKILFDRGLDVFQRYEMNNAFDLSNRLQQYRQCKAFEVTFLKVRS